MAQGNYISYERELDLEGEAYTELMISLKKAVRTLVINEFTTLDAGKQLVKEAKESALKINSAFVKRIVDYMRDGLGVYRKDMRVARKLFYDDCFSESEASFIRSKKTKILEKIISDDVVIREKIVDHILQSESDRLLLIRETLTEAFQGIKSDFDKMGISTELCMKSNEFLMQLEHRAKSILWTLERWMEEKNIELQDNSNKKGYLGKRRRKIHDNKGQKDLFEMHLIINLMSEIINDKDKTELTSIIKSVIGESEKDVASSNENTPVIMDYSPSELLDKNAKLEDLFPLSEMEMDNLMERIS